MIVVLPVYFKVYLPSEIAANDIMVQNSTCSDDIEQLLPAYKDATIAKREKVCRSKVLVLNRATHAPLIAVVPF